MTGQAPATDFADVVIVGGGPAGLAAAIALRQKGIDSLVVEALEPPIDKCCGEGLMPDGLHSLKALGVEIRQEEGYAFQGIRFANRTHCIDADFPNGTGIGVRRTHLHQRLIDRASEVGVRLIWGARATLPSQTEVLVNGVPTRFRWLIGADGTASRVRRWAGLAVEKAFSQRVAFRCHYEIAPWSEALLAMMQLWPTSWSVHYAGCAHQIASCIVFVCVAARAVREHNLDGTRKSRENWSATPVMTET